MERDYTIVMFLKFGKPDDITDLYENGTIYMNSIQSFRKIEDDCLRGDRYEGVSSIMNSTDGYIEVLGKKINLVNVHVPESREIVFGNIYCLYCVSSFGFTTPADFKIDEKVREFGSHCLVIFQPGEFLSRIEQKLNLMAWTYRTGFVEYYDKHTVNGKIHVFQKPREYEYQKEFRIYVAREFITPLVFEIGSLKDIAQIYPTDVAYKLELKHAATVA